MPKNGDVVFENAKFGKLFCGVRKNLTTLLGMLSVCEFFIMAHNLEKQ